MMKKAFTLAEVLITLSIIGVVAALTMPALTSNVGGAKVGPSLAKFVNTFENSMQSMFIEEGMSVITTDPSLGKDTLELMKGYMPMTRLSRSDVTIQLQNPYTKSVIKTIKGNSDYVYVMRDGMILIFTRLSDQPNEDCDWSESTAKNEIKPYKACIGGVTVLLNGLKGTNYVGKTAFLFYIDSSGTLVPYGSSAHRDVQKSAFDYEDVAKCRDHTSKEYELYACTGAIADNGWKVPW